MRIGLLLRHPAYLRLFESTIAELVRRGHELTLVFTDPRRAAPAGPVATMLQRVRDLDGVSISDWHPEVTKRNANADPVYAMRLWQDYLHHNEPPLTDAPKLRIRSGEKLPQRVRELSDALEGQPELSRLLRVALGVGERVLAEPTERIRRFLDEEQPDLIVATMLVGRARQIDVVRAARRAGIPTAYACASWDNLVTAGLLHAMPDTVAVWNEWQRDDATALHGVPASAVTVTGAPVYDVWFDASPMSDRNRWCREVGLDPARPYLLYVCSSRFITEDESAYIESWFGGLRATRHPEIDGIQLLVRPHPQNPVDRTQLDHIEGLVVHPCPAELPVDEQSRARYVDAIHHSAAVVGVNTSALIESAILGRSVHVHISKQYAATQTGTVHFRQLLEAAGGVVEATSSRPEHYAGLAAAVGGAATEATAAKAREFVSAFVRPNGLDRPATPILADVLEQTGALKVTANGSDPDLDLAADELRALVEKLW